MSIKKIKNDRNQDKTYCKSISKSLYDILRFSLNEDFRKKSFDVFGVSSSKEVEKEVNKRLLTIVKDSHSNKLISENFFSSAPSGISLENNLLATESSDEEKSYLRKETFDKVLPFVHFAKRNQSHISSETKNENVKRKKLCYYSQPSFTEAKNDDIDLEFSNCNIHYNNSLPINSSSSSFSLSQEDKLSLESCDNNLSYYKIKFKELFKDDQKNFEKNSK